MIVLKLQKIQKKHAVGNKNDSTHLRLNLPRETAVKLNKLTAAKKALHKYFPSTKIAHPFCNLFFDIFTLLRITHSKKVEHHTHPPPHQSCLHRKELPTSTTS